MNDNEQNYEKKFTNFISKLASYIVVDKPPPKTKFEIDQQMKKVRTAIFLSAFIIFSLCSIWIANNRYIFDIISSPNPEISYIDYLIVIVLMVWLISFGILVSILLNWWKTIFNKTQAKFTTSKAKLFCKFKESPPGVFLDSIRVLGYSFGKRAFLLPMLPILEKEGEQLDYSQFTVSILPPIAYDSHIVCEKVINRYGKAGPILILAILAHYFSIIAIMIFAILIIIGIVRLVSFSFLLSLAGIVLGLLTGVFSSLISRSFWFGTIAPFQERSASWAQCEYEHRLREKVTDIASEVDKTIVESLDSKFAVLRVLYSDEVNKTEAAIQKRQEAVEQLKRIASQRDITHQTMDDFVGLLEYILDQRLREEHQKEEQNEKRNFVRERIADLVIGILFFLLGVAVSK